MQAASSTTDPTATIAATTTPAGTDPIGQFSHTNTNTTPTPTAASAVSSSSVNTVQNPPSVHMSSPPHKPRFTRSPTPYTLQDMVKDDKEDSHHSRSPLQQALSASRTASNLIPNPTSSTRQHTSNNSSDNSSIQNYIYLNDNTSSNHTNSIDSNGMKEAGQHFPSSFKITSSTISKNSDININNSNNSLDYKKPTAGWTLFAQLAKMTPEEVELIRLTKANTAANKQIGALPVALVSPVVVQSDSNSGSSSSSSSTMDAPLPKSSSPKRARQRRRELSSSPPPISLSVVSETPFLASPSEGDKSSDSRSSPLTNERGSLSPLSEYSSSSSSSSSLSSVPSSQSSPSPESTPHRRKRSKLDRPSMPPSALWSSRRRKPSLSPPKSVQIDESKNMVFSYLSSSTIEALLPVDDAAGSGSSTDDNDQRVAQQEPLPIMDEVTYNRFSTRDCLDWDLPYLGYPGYKAQQEEYAKSLGTTVYTMPHTADSPGPGQSGSFGNRKPSSSSSSSSSLSPSQTSWTPEAGGSLDSVLSDSGPNAFANIASSLDTLWSPPMLRRTISEVSSARKRLRPSLSTFSGPAKAAGVGESSETGVWKAPMLRRQASMPSLEREMSEENPFLEQPPVRRPASSQPQESSPTMATATGVKDPILSVLESTTSIHNECQEVVMTEVESETSAAPPSAPIASTTIVSGSSKSSRGVIRRRDTRQLHHPYRRRASASTTLSQDGSIDETLLRLPTQFRRSASFAGTTNTPPAQPALRREASTTAYMDTL